MVSKPWGKQGKPVVKVTVVKYPLSHWFSVSGFLRITFDTCFISSLCRDLWFALWRFSVYLAFSILVSLPHCIQDQSSEARMSDNRVLYSVPVSDGFLLPPGWALLGPGFPNQTSHRFSLQSLPHTHSLPKDLVHVMLWDGPGWIRQSIY